MLVGIDLEHACRYRRHATITWIRLGAPSPYEPNFWIALSELPLSIEPAIECLACGVRGLITDGKWILLC